MALRGNYRIECNCGAVVIARIGWTKGVAYLREHAGCRLVHVPTGNVVSTSVGVYRAEDLQ